MPTAALLKAPALERLRAGLAHAVLGIEVRGQSPRPDKSAIWAHSQGALVAKNSPANAGYARVVGLIPALGRPPGGGNGNLIQYSFFLPGKFHGQRILAGYSLWDCKESDTPEHTHHHQPDHFFPYLLISPALQCLLRDCLQAGSLETEPE